MFLVGKSAEANYHGPFFSSGSCGRHACESAGRLPSTPFYNFKAKRYSSRSATLPFAGVLTLLIEFKGELLFVLLPTDIHTFSLRQEGYAGAAPSAEMAGLL